MASSLEYVSNPLLIPFNAVLWMLPAVLAMKIRKKSEDSK